jgi:hypothetical protein
MALATTARVRRPTSRGWRVWCRLPHECRNIFGVRGADYAISPTKDTGVVIMFDWADNTGEIWPHPYWISDGGWCVRPFWDHYLVTGDPLP